VDGSLRSGRELHDFVAALFPFPRSLTGDGVRRTLDAVASRVPLVQHEVPSGTEVLDWVVPPEWVVREAWIAGPDGRRVVDVADSPLHLLGYSVPTRQTLSREDLLPHLHSLPDRPDWTPFRTSYYTPQWGFCLPHRLLASLPPGGYEVCVDSELRPGSLTYGELVLPGREPGEVLVSTHVCHPEQANDNLSGIAVATALAEHLQSLASRRWTYRFLFVPGTLGSLAWLASRRDDLPPVRAGLVLTGLGDPAPITWKRSRRGGTWADRVVEHVLARRGEHRVLDFSPYGYDERQYCSPGFDLPVGRLGRGVHGEYPEYHTSADDLALVGEERLEEALLALVEVTGVLERDRTYRNLSPYGEPQLGRRGLYRSIGASLDSKAAELALLWVLSGSDGRTSLLDVAGRSGLAVSTLADAAEQLVAAGLLEEVLVPPA